MFVVVEVQSNSDGTVGTLVNNYESEQEAASKYHQILASGAVSQIYKHCAFILSDDGYCTKSEGYRHEQ